MAIGSEPQRIVWLEEDPRTRREGFPMDRPAFQPLGMAEIRIAGIDYLIDRYHAGTPVCATHLVYIPLSGAVQYDCGSIAGRLSTGNLLVAPARGPHWLILKSGKCEAAWFHLNDAPRWSELRSRGPVVRPVRNREAIASLMRLALQETTSSAFAAEQNLGHLCPLTINLLIRELDVGEPSARSAVAEQLDELWRCVNRHLSEPWTVDRMAKKCSMSAGHFHAQMQAVWNQTPQQMLTRLRMEHASTLLLGTGLTLDRIAEQVGYTSTFAFSNAFLRFSGKRPGEYRKAGTASAYGDDPKTPKLRR